MICRAQGWANLEIITTGGGAVGGIFVAEWKREEDEGNRIITRPRRIAFALSDKTIVSGRVMKIEEYHHHKNAYYHSRTLLFTRAISARVDTTDFGWGKCAR